MPLLGLAQRRQRSRCTSRRPRSVANRKEAERLILWALVERKRPLSSLTTGDAMAYRAFLRRPTTPFREPQGARQRGQRRWMRPVRWRLVTVLINQLID